MSDPSPAELAIERAGTPTALAKGVGVTLQAVLKWKKSGKIPAERVPAVSSVTGIPRYRLRPDLPDLFPPPNGRRAA